MKPLRFRRFQWQRKNWIPVNLGAASIAGILLLCANAQAEDFYEPKYRDCMALYKGAEIFEDKTIGKLLDKFDADKQCVKNISDNHFNSYNISALTPPILKKRPESFGGNGPEKTRGLCKVSYDAIKEAAARQAEYHSLACSRVANAFSTAQNCSPLPKLDCESEWKAATAALDSFAQDTRRENAGTRDYLLALRSALVSLASKYREDRKPMMLAVNKKPASEVFKGRLDGPCLKEKPTIKAENGGVLSCEAYYNLLLNQSLSAGAEADGQIISEITDTQAKMMTVIAQINHQYAGNLAWAQEQYKRYQDLIASARKNGPADDNPLNTKNISALTSAGSATQSLFGGSTSRPMIQPPPIAALAAVGAAGAIAASSLSSSSRSASAVQAPASYTPPPISRLNEPVASPTESSTTAGNPAGPLAGAPKSDENGDKTETLVAPVLPNGGTEGASRALSSKAEAAKPATGGSGGAGDDASTSAFKPSSLDPKPIPMPPATNGGNEVANLLGQMKDLFSFGDSPPPLPMGSGGGPLPMGHEGDAGAMGDAAGMDGSMAEGESTEAAQGDAAAGEDGAIEQAGLYGKLDEALFDRVHRRHQKCMERGQVLYGLKEKVE